MQMPVLPNPTHTAQDNLALEQAIVAYSDSLQYLPSDITTISEEVAEGLVASGSGHDKATLLSGRQVELWNDIAKQTGKARQVAFSRALRKELERISAALPVASSTSVRRSRTESEDATPGAPAGNPQPQPLPEPARLQAPVPNARQYIQQLKPLQPVQPLQPSQPLQPLKPLQPNSSEVAPSAVDDLSLRHIDVQKDDARFASHPWMGVPCWQQN